VILRDQGRLLPKPGFFAQMSQTAATVLLLRIGYLTQVHGSPGREGNRIRLADGGPQPKIVTPH
jgi:hypothetical protein